MLTKWKPNTTNLLLRNTLTEENCYAFELDLVNGQSPNGTPFSSDEMNKIVDEVNRNTPPGVINAYAGVRAPEGWLLCDGKVYKRDLYQALYEVIGNTYGGDWAKGEFALPNLYGRVPVGWDPTEYGSKYQKFNTLGHQGGKMQQELRAAIGATDDLLHQIGYKSEDAININMVSYNLGIVAEKPIYDSPKKVNHSTAVYTPEGENMYLLQPYLVLNYIIKY